MPQLREQADQVVVLCYTSPGGARRLVDEVPGIDVLIVGNNPGYRFNPERVANTLIRRGAAQGKYLNQLDLVLDAQGRTVDYNGEALPVHLRLEEKESIAKKVAAWESSREMAAK